MRDHANPRIAELGQDSGGRVRGRIVDNDDFDINMLLGERSLDRAGKEMRAISGWDDDRCGRGRSDQRSGSSEISKSQVTAPSPAGRMPKPGADTSTTSM
jgi:hypothetical protein